MVIVNREDDPRFILLHGRINDVAWERDELQKFHIAGTVKCEYEKGGKPEINFQQAKLDCSMT